MGNQLEKNNFSLVSLGATNAYIIIDCLYHTLGYYPFLNLLTRNALPLRILKREVLWERTTWKLDMYNLWIHTETSSCGC